MDLPARIEALISPSLNEMGYDVVRVRLSGAVRPTLQVMAERSDGLAMSVDDCTIISRALSAVLDVEDPIKGHYNLEVSSPGIDRPLIRRKDFERFAGFEARIEMNRLIDGRKRFRGRLLGLVDDFVRVALEDGEVSLPLAEIDRAKLVMTDELLTSGNPQRRV